MVSSFASMATAALAFAVSATAVATPNLFSWESWVNEIIANPNGTHLSSEEAVVASEASRDALISRVDDGALVSRQLGPGGCNNIPGRALSTDAAKCVNYIAAFGSYPCAADGHATFCTIGTATIMGVTGDGVDYDSTTCAIVAQTAGKIMDMCCTPDGTVQGWRPSTPHMDISIYKTGA